MKRAILIVFLAFFLSGCNGGATSNSLTLNSLTTSSQQSSEVQEVTITLSQEEQEYYYNRYIKPLAFGHILAHNWESFDYLANHPTPFTGFIIEGIVGEEQWLEISDKYYDKSDFTVYIPEEIVETILTKYFDVEVEQLRSMNEYKRTRNAYAYRGRLDDGLQDVKILSVHSDGNVLTLLTEHAIYNDGIGKSTLTIIINGEDFKYISNIVDNWKPIDPKNYEPYN